MKRVLIHILSLALLVGGAAAQVVQEHVPELEGIDVEEHLGDTIPLHLSFVDDHGQTVRLGDYFDRDKPVALILGYYECPMLCNLVFNGLTAAIPDLGLAMGDQYQIINVSIDPAETPELAAAKKANYLDALGSAASADGWAFLTGDSAQIAALAGALGFKYYYVEDRDEYAHPAVVHILSERGVISRYLYGIQYNPRDVKLALLEASEGKIGSTLDRIILYCFHYDPDAGSYVVFARNVMLIGGVLTVIVLGAFLLTLWLRERHRKVHRPAPRESNRVSVG